MKSFRLLISALLLVLVFASGNTRAQDFVCINTDPLTGELTLSWSFPSNPNTVDYYFIQWSLINGSWNSTDSAGFSAPSAVTSYTIPGSNGNSNKYFIRLVTQNTNTTGSEILVSNLILSVTEINKGIARLNWNPVWQGADGTHTVQRKDNAIWKNLFTTPNNPATTAYSYIDTLTYPYCDTATVEYKITFTMPGAPCSSESNSASGEFLDMNAPGNPINDTVSIYKDPMGPYTGCPIIGWTKSPEKDIAGYIIYREDPVFQAIDTIPSDSTIFLDKAVRGCSKTFRYALAAIDSCGKTSYGTYVMAPNNIKLDTLSIDPCERKAWLKWNAYHNMPGGLGGYIIYRQVNFSNFVTVDTVDAATTAFYDSLQFINGNDYTYYIRAFSASGLGSSSSCMRKVTYQGPVTPDTLYITQASILNNSLVEVSYYYSPVNRINHLVLERADAATGPFTPVDTLIAATGYFLPQRFQLTDGSANVSSQSYYYRLSMIDSCDKVAMYSENIARTIYLECNSPDLSHNSLQWNEYSEWYTGVDQYELYRLVNGVPDPSGVHFNTGGPPLSYLDQINTLPPTAQVCYYVRAVEASGDPVSPLAFSISNTVCALREPMFIMPNAFNPESVNNRFRPVYAFVDPGSFFMQIYSKWGQMIFETDDIVQGWNGWIGDKAAPSDMYVYYVKYKSLQGESYEKRGTVVLIK